MRNELIKAGVASYAITDCDFLDRDGRKEGWSVHFDDLPNTPAIRKLVNDPRASVSDKGVWFPK